MSSYGTLISFCGKMGAGKSTLPAEVARDWGAVLISEGEWPAALFPGEINNFDDYIHCSSGHRPFA